jgi:hypothetical protein
MKNISKAILAAIIASFEKYESDGARSTEKLKPLHEFAGSLLAEITKGRFELSHMSTKGGELKVAGAYYPKDVDIVLSQKKCPAFCLGIKFVTSNYKQNANNYFEGMMGETANIQSAGIPYAQLIILRQRTPYFQRGQVYTKTEVINEHDISKYLHLMKERPSPHRPAAIALVFVRGLRRGSPRLVDPAEIFSDSKFASEVSSRLSLGTLTALLEKL